MSTTDRRAYIYVMAGAALWGIIGVFVQFLFAAGFSALEIVTLRVTTAAAMLTGYLAVRHPTLLVIDVRDVLSFVGTGIFSIVFFNWAYFTAIGEVSLSVAVMLLYTGPAFVVLLSRLFFGEPLTARKGVALLLTLAGCILVVQLLPLHRQHVSWYGLLLGLGSGLGYALYSIFGKQALRRYEPLTVITYTFLFASAALLPFNIFRMETAQLASLSTWLWIAGLGFFPTALAYGLYTTGLSMIESGRASVTATVEPVVATVVGVALFNDMLTVYQLAGMVLVVAAVVLVQGRKVSAGR